MPNNEQDFHISKNGQTAVLKFGRTVERTQANSLWENARDLAQHGGQVVVDVDATSQFDIGALQVLLAFDAELRKAGTSLTTTGMSEMLAGELRAAGCHALIGGGLK